ncbi:MAG TPA: GDSL family lipase [Nitrospiraceae bacterium]|nr:GDSL family lipase [Nitrospiraceae bacterium]
MEKRRSATLLFIGDSLIEYFDWEKRFPGHTVYNLGVSGETVGGLRARLNRIMAHILPPDKVFIMTGINNLAMGDSHILDEYRDIVRQIYSSYPVAAIYVQSLLPVIFPYITNEDIRKMNSTLRDMAAEQGAFFLDLHALFIDEKEKPIAAYLLDDGVHVSDAGYHIWSAAVERLLRD